jgi:glycogen synthase
MPNNMIKTLISICTLIGIVFGAYFYIDETYAGAEYVQKLEQRLDHKIVSDIYEEIDYRIWTLEQRFKDTEMPLTIKEEYRKLLMKRSLLENELEKIRGK